jgi:signal transduction histidine kinase
MVSSFVLVPLICTIIYGTLTGTVLARPTKTRIIFAFYLLMAALWSLSSTMAHLGLDHQQTYFWSKGIAMAGVPMMVFYYHFVRRLANKPADWGVYTGYGIGLAVVGLTATGHILQDAYFADGSLHMDYVNQVTNFLILVTSTYMVAAMVLLVRYYRSSIEHVNRNRAIYLLVGISAFAIVGMTKVVPSLFMYPLDYVGGVINAAIITYAILRYQLLDIKFVLQKGLVYSGLTLFLTTFYLLVLFALQQLFQNWSGLTSVVLVAGFVLLGALLFNPLRNYIQKRIDRLFYRETYDYRQMLFNFSNKINNVLDLGELAQSILEPIVKAMHVKRAALLLPEVGNGDFNARFVQQATDEEPFTKLRFLSDNPIIAWLATKGEVLRRELLDIAPQFKGLWEVERVALDALGVQLLCPIRSKGNLIGILALGGKKSLSLYSDEEADLLMTMANEAAVAVENARMLDTLKSQQLQVEQLLAQVVLAQEEERNRISIDLHDSVAQWLVATSYGIQTFREALSTKKVDKARRELGEMESIVDKSLKELRRVVVGLRPPALDELGLTHALRQSLEDLKNEGVECKFSQEGTPVRLPSSMEIGVYRVVQEALTNIRKHANATKVSLRLGYQADKLLVEIRDNGQGFDLSQTLTSAISVGHLGLLGMKQRAEMLGGDIQIKTNEGKGTTITLSLNTQSRVEGK